MRLVDGNANCTMAMQMDMRDMTEQAEAGGCWFVG